MERYVPGTRQTSLPEIQGVSVKPSRGIGNGTIATKPRGQSKIINNIGNGRIATKPRGQSKIINNIGNGRIASDFTLTPYIRDAD